MALLRWPIAANAVHTGIKTVIFIDKIPDLDTIAIGPDIRDAHTPQEHGDLPFMIFTRDLLNRILANMEAYVGLSTSSDTA